jgi:hypothetical protein
MFYIEDGREHFYQWDTNCRLIVEDESIKEVHFCNRTDSCSLVCEVYFHDDDYGGLYVVNVPNIILQEDLKFRAFGYDGNRTLHEECFEVKKRSKPSDYVYTETEVKRLEDVEAKVAELEDKVANIKIDVVPEHTHYVAGEPTDNTEQVDIMMIPNRQSTSYMTSYNFDRVDVGEAATVTLFINEFMDIQVDSKATNSIDSIIADGNKWIYGVSNPSGIFYDEVNEKIEIKFFSAGTVKFTKFHKKATAEVGFIDAESMKFIKNHNLLSGDGEKSIAQVKDTNAWLTVNEQVKDYIKNDKAGANNGAKINAVKSSNAVYVGAFGKLSTMLGGKSQAMGGKSHAEGSKTIALENNSHTEGNETFAAGAHSHAEGNVTSAIGAQSHSEGLLTVAQGDCAHAEGEVTTASGISAHSEGTLTTASGDYSHAEGYDTYATGENSHSEGWENEASGYASHVQGGRNLASGAYSFASGFENTASKNYQTVIGVAAQQSATEHLFIIGNGTLNDDYSVNKRGNALTVNKDGTLTVYGDIKSQVGRKRISLTDLLARIEALEGLAGVVNNDISE